MEFEGASGWPYMAGPSSAYSYGVGGGAQVPFSPTHITPHMHSVPMVDTARADREAATMNQMAVLQKEVEALRLQNRSLDSANKSLQHSLGQAEARRLEAIPQLGIRLQRRQAEAQESSRLQQEKDGLIRQLRQSDLECRNAISSLQQEIRTMKSYEEQLRTQIDLEKKASADKMETLRADHSRELAAAGRDTDRGISDGRSRASDLESTIGKLQSERERDRDALTDAEKRSRALEAKISKLNDDVTRRDDLVGMHEKEGQIKQERIDEALMLVAALQANITEIETEHRKTVSDLELRVREAASLKKEGDTLRETLKTEQRSTEKWHRAYSTLGTSLGATALDIGGLNLDGTASKLVAELKSIKGEVTKAELALEAKKADVQKEKLKSTQLTRDRDNALETAAVRADEVMILKEDLLHSTQELRGLTTASQIAATGPPMLVSMPSGAAPLTSSWASLSRVQSGRRYAYDSR